MPVFSPEVLSQWLSAEWRGGVPREMLTGICTDTRTLRPGELYVALQGERFDGHDFVRQAFANGAAGALVQEGYEYADGPVLQAANTLLGLQALAAGYRTTWTAVTIGITGSVGKTTVKEMCADVLSMRGDTHRTAGNYNNHIGLPLSMLAMPCDAAYGVFEIGMSRPGEIDHLAALLRPGIAILTDIADAHREAFDSLEAIALEKARLAAQVPPSGKVILDCDSEWFELIRRHTCAGVKTISMQGDADYIGRPVDPLTLEVESAAALYPPRTFPVPLPGEHMMRNALRAVVLGYELGVPPEDIAEGLRRFRPAPMRWERSEIDGIEFINDAYNANPLSMRANLKTFAVLPGGGRKWAVIGGMRELGAVAEAEHAALGRCIDGLGLDGVITVGALGRMITCRTGRNVFHTDSCSEAARILRRHLRSGDRVLLKASRGERLEQVLEYFKEM